MARIFVSYSRADRQFVDEFVPLLRRVYGLDDVWYDDQIHGGADWWHMILHEVAACDLFVYLVSNDSLTSPYCQAECREALRLRKQILPVIVRPKTDYPGTGPEDLVHLLRRTQYVDMSRGFRDHLAISSLYAAANRLLDLAPEHGDTPLSADAVSEPTVVDRPRQRRVRRTYLAGGSITVGIVVVLAVLLIMTLGGNDENGGADATQTFMASSPLQTTTSQPELPETTVAASASQPTATPESQTTAPEPSTTPTPVGDVGSCTPTGTVWADDGGTPVPLAGARVSLEHRSYVRDGRADETVSDANGRFSFAPLLLHDTDTLRVQVELEGYSSQTIVQGGLDTWPACHFDITLLPEGPPDTSSTLAPDVMALARTFNGGNDDWVPVIHEFDGVEMVLVPAGCFMMGSEDGYSDEEPVHQVCFEEPFWIDRTEVTNGQFAAFGGQAAQESNWPDADRPREQITWFEAHDFCALRGARLPTEAEWEYTARGPQSWEYPWGDVFDSDKVIWKRDEDQGTAPVGSKPEGASWVGALDMTGNVSEWVADWHAAYDTLAPGVVNPLGPDEGYNRVLRGGAWSDFSTSYILRAANRFNRYPGLSTHSRGFRCAVSASDALAAFMPDLMAWATTFNGSNDDWVPVIHEFDGVEMVLVPAGCFMMGSEDGYGDEEPVHQVCFEEPFWIDRTEVTNGQFAVFDGQAEESSYSAEEDRPCEKITWYEAQAFCESRGARLPTEAEWEYAARGPDALIYPWGNVFECSLGNFDDETTSDSEVVEGGAGCDGFDETAPVGSFPDGASWVGALDMSGNVWEWVADWYDAGYYAMLEDGVVNPTGPGAGVYRALRSGSWYITLTDDLCASKRGKWNLDDRIDGFGFRCARSALG